MSRITDSIYYTLLSDGCSSEQAAQSARSFYDPFHVDRFDSYPLVSSREERRIMRRSTEAAVKGNPGHPGCFAIPARWKICDAARFPFSRFLLPMYCTTTTEPPADMAVNK